MDALFQIFWLSFWVALLGAAIIVFRIPRRDRKITHRIEKEEAVRSVESPKGPPVTEEESIQGMFERIRSLASVLYASDLPSIRIQLASPDELKTTYAAKYGLNTQPNAIFQNDEDDGCIFVQHGLPEEALFVALSREFAHAWQEIDGFPAISVEQREGFAQWIAYRLSEADGRDAEALFEDCEGLAASGLRKFLALEEKYGAAGAIKAAKSNTLNLKALR